MNSNGHLRLHALRPALILIVAFVLNISGFSQVKYSGAVIRVPGETVSPQLKGLNLQLLFDGVADLYYQVDGRTCYYYITDRNGRLFTLSVPRGGNKARRDESDQWRQGALTVLRAVMYDAPALSGRIETVMPDRQDLTALMREYHDAVSRPGQMVYYEIPPPAFRPYAGLFAGYNADFISPGNSGDLEGYSMDQALYPVAGITLGATLPRISDRLSLVLDLTAGKRYFYGYYNPSVAPYPMTEIHRELHMHNLLVTGNLKTVYRFGKGNVKPSVSGGLCIRSVVSDDSRIEADILYGDIVISDTYEYNTGEKTSFGVTLGMGLSFEISDKISLTTALDYSEFFITELPGGYRSAGLKLGINF
jgi:hypothetical protein